MNISAPKTIIKNDPTSASAPKAVDEVVRLSNIKRMFGDTPAVNDISLSVNRGEILGIIGRSGAGKSTLIRCLNGLERPDSGSVIIEAQEITGLSESQLQPVRRRIGMIFQHFNLMSAKTVAQNIAMPLKIAGIARTERVKITAELLELVGLSDRAGHYPAQLSGGQKQRVGIARALAAKPSLLLSDEATSALDPETTQSILALLKDINQKLGLTILLITHEMDVIRRIADRVIVLDHGQIAEQGPVWEVFARPQAETTKSLVKMLTPALPESIASQLKTEACAQDEAILRIRISGNAARRPVITDLAQACGLNARIIHGGIDTVQNEPVGTLFLSVPAQNPAALQQAVAFLNTICDETEVAGYVSVPDTRNA
ncbi:Methionine import ATP-binding protein MetN [Pseudochrobactrum sp. MP213Fo]